MAYNFQAALESGLTPQQITNYLTAQGRGEEAHVYFNMSTPEKKPSLISHVLGGIKDYANNVVSDFKQRGQNLSNDFKKTSLSLDYNPKVQQNIGTTALSTVGNIAGGVGDMFSELLKPVIQKGADALSNNKTFQNIATSTVGDQATKAVDKAGAVYEALKVKHPEIAKDLENSLNVAALVGPEAKTADLTEQGIRTGAKAVQKTALDTAENLGVAVEKSNRIIKGLPSKVSDAITPIEQSVITEAEKSSIPKATRLQRAQSYLKQASEAMADNSKPTPLELAGNEAQKALKTIDDELKQAGQSKNKATKVVGEKFVGSIVEDALSKLDEGVKNRFGGSIDKFGDISNASGRILKIGESEQALIKKIREKLIPIKTLPTVQRVDDAIDFIQKELYKSEKNLTLPANKDVNGLLREVTGKLNKKLKTVAGTEYTKANQRFSELKYLKDTLNEALGVDANKGASLMKQLFSPSGTAPRKLFNQIKKETGIDLVNEATLAKFAMENVGDVRQESLLKQILTGQALSKRGVINIAADRLIKKVQNPSAKLIRTIKKSE